MRRLFPLLVGLLFCTHLVLAQQELHRDATAPTNEDSLQLILAVQELVESYYVDDIDQQELLDGAMRGMLQVLDPHSTYLRPHTLALLRDNNRGHYYGYGLEVSVDDDQIRVVAPLANSSAEVAGVQPGDVLVKVDDLVADAQDLDPMIAYIKQASIEDRSLWLTLERQGLNDPLRVQLSPAEVQVISSLSERLPNDIGYLKISSFNQRTAHEVRIALQELRRQPLNGLVLDLRNNPGGLLDAAVQVADMFLTDGVIVSTHGRYLDANSLYRASRLTLMADLPMVVLINEGSASAAEILAAALKDQQRATLVGEKTFGKGTVQSLIPLLNDRGAIKLTTARYASPKGTFIDQVGLSPDLTVDGRGSIELISRNSLLANWSDDPQLFAAYDHLQQHLQAHAAP